MNVVTQLAQFVGHDVINKNTTDLAVRCSTGSVEFSRVELCHYKPFVFCPSRLPSRVKFFLSLHKNTKRIYTKLAEGKSLTRTDYIMGVTGTGTREQDIRMNVDWC